MGLTLAPDSKYPTSPLLEKFFLYTPSLVSVTLPSNSFPSNPSLLKPSSYFHYLTHFALPLLYFLPSKPFVYPCVYYIHCLLPTVYCLLYTSFSSPLHLSSPLLICFVFLSFPTFPSNFGFSSPQWSPLPDHHNLTFICLL